MKSIQGRLNRTHPQVLEPNHHVFSSQIQVLEVLALQTADSFVQFSQFVLV